MNELSTQIEKTGRFMMVKKAKDAGQILRFASMWNMEGIVVIGFCAQDYQTLRNHMRIPFVVYDGICRQTERIVNLSIDNSGGGEQVGRHFRALGHTRALCLSDNETGIDRDRIEGFFRGFAPGHAELLRIPMQKDARWAYYGQQLERLRGVTAVFAVSDHYAIDLMSFLRGKGIAVPEEISVAGLTTRRYARWSARPGRTAQPVRGSPWKSCRRCGRAGRLGRRSSCRSRLWCGAARGYGNKHSAQIKHLIFVESYALNLCVPHIRSLQ